MNVFIRGEEKLTMTKKAFLIVCLCIVALCSVYANKLSILAQVTPYSFQNVSATGGKYRSTNGFGMRGGVRYNVWNNLNVGIDAEYSAYKYKELSGDYNVIGLRAVAGYVFDFTEKFYAEAEVGVGMDLRQVDTAKMVNFGLDGYLGCGFRLSDELALNGGAGLGLGFQSGKKSKSTDLAFKTRLGLQFML